MTFYFAWVEPGDTTFTSAFERYDEQLLSFSIQQSEGDFATLTARIKNSGLGLLAPTRKRWAWLSWDDGASTVTPLFFGRIVGVPEAQDGEVLVLTLVARPSDYAARKETLADTLRALPEHDPVWINPRLRDDPDVVLEARSALWHIDRTSHAVTVSDIVTAEDGTVNLGTGFIRDSLAVRYSHMPKTRVAVEATVTWPQKKARVLDVSRRLSAASKAAGSVRDNVVTTYTGQGLIDDWPDSGTKIGGGWSVRRTALFRLDGIYVPRSSFRARTAYTSRISFPLWTLAARMTLDLDATRERSETLALTVDGGVQAVLDDVTESGVAEIALSADVSEAIGGTRPIGYLQRRSYFRTDRGRQSLQNLALRARALLRAEARCIEISADVTWADALLLTCRKAATLTDARLPGGTATGKIKAYSIFMDPQSGAWGGTVTIGCVPGTGGSLSADTEVPVYANAGYANDGWQDYASGQEVLSTADLGLGHLGGQAPDDDGVDLDTFDAGDVVVSCVLANGQTAQEAALSTGISSAAGAINTLKANASEFTLTMKPLDGLAFSTAFTATATDLVLPQQIDLEASA